MKRCPACDQNYTDETLSFCLSDGAPLLSVGDPSSPSPDSDSTVPYTPARDTNPPPTEVYRPGPSPGGPYSPTPNWSPTPSASQKSSALPWIIGGIVALVVLGFGVIFVAAIIVSMSMSSNSNNSNNSNYAASNRNRSDNSSSSNSRDEQQNTPPATAKTLDVAGIWNGSSDGTPATLVIRRSDSNSYDGVETAGEFKDEMFVKVEVSPATRSIIIKEVRKLKGDNWNLGTNEGTISSDGRSMSGTAKDAKGKSYSWSFTKK
jgi:hypothetical protein